MIECNVILLANNYSVEIEQAVIKNNDVVLYPRAVSTY